MSEKNKVAIVSDTHMADPDFPPSQKTRFMKFLDEFVKEEVKELILLGDIFELSQCGMSDVYERCIDILLKFLEVANSGTLITYIQGNHDFTFSDLRGFNILPHPEIRIILPRKIDLPVREYVGRGGKGTRQVKSVSIETPAHFRTIQGRKVFLAHGHEFNHYFRGDPNSFSTIIRAAGALEKINPALDDRILEMMENARKGLLNTYHNLLTPWKAGISESEREFTLAARDICKYIATGDGKLRERNESEKIDYVFFGHTHIQEGPVILSEDVLEGSGKEYGRYFNTGTWVVKDRRADYTVITEDGNVQNLQWR